MNPLLSDAFALLGLPRHPVLEEADLTRAYDAQTRREAADREALNQARSILASPAQRLKHYLILAGNGDLSGQVPLDEELMKAFSRVSEALHAAAEVSRKKKQATTALAEAVMTRQLVQARDALAALQEELRHLEARQLENLHALCPPGEVPSPEAGLAPKLAALQGSFTFLERWRAQARLAWSELF